ncbi:DUF3299 domain-containing protein [Idiomarina xiamenensis]|uniref:Lipoprotein n=1 Tax=Idiomarina xiamenensis 10-D-4 TaxID=740709 RepID=K2KHG0_9GAMM|nr:DUF3299 domain-containing protein [Idiomarina xiamenensis]EKE87438.1 hypothetical protein A10D4_00040 [Idiomarina xiamenensis 10-D-4]
MKYLLTAILALFSLSAMAEPELVAWKDLVPEGFTPPPVRSQQYYDENPDEARQLNLDAPVVQSFDGKSVRIPGYIVQLEGDADKVTEFLLVPYFGACIHVPPPPPNQIIHVKFAEGEGVPYELTYDAVWIEGTMHVERYEGDLAVVGYTMDANKVESYY